MVLPVTDGIGCDQKVLRCSNGIKWAVTTWLDIDINLCQIEMKDSDMLCSNLARLKLDSDTLHSNFAR